LIIKLIKVKKKLEKNSDRLNDVDTQRCLIMQKTGTATWDLTSLRRPREGVSPPSLQQQDRTFSFRNHVMLSEMIGTFTLR
jgi:hypothetical protein